MSYLAGNVEQGFVGSAEFAVIDDPMIASLLNGLAVDQGNFHEMAALVLHAERLGADLVQFRLADDSLTDIAHPLHLAFLETLRDPVLSSPVAELGDVAPWRDRALAAELPSDALDAEYDRERLVEAIQAALPSAEQRIALCAAGRIRFCDEHELFGREAQALYELGLPELARLRLAECVALGGEAIAIA